jgi:hypothetical protein
VRLQPRARSGANGDVTVHVGTIDIHAVVGNQ